ncbi:hypothetical protein COW36_24080 [bacterium (Candidatus Blackallbacteria) CG17_big_fil_post_rev_8_21_14_2_50_48_46]|uniref:SMP-30/Gluconolactonase/LRE-like region domain-containing protein n=1 Tax=bacterium (Candidatus Blackallbacteria) CG17_big_fil_post_rev_8_21_14_2_50_48_46 TaxID=2014261 RepID=A0A2M7FWY3_9BACT|nr:MAG: hypothetical protein COW64_19020 [bacterium (Candidatus Blackallbacteria) CG18_big_fil_WC_8_21_14_2_50_49_26]PIW13750.1 MAG: hypothetical protein COW36_24080 [bacterium (Candidatus Blackallbacteria) CG17_big_fil_post_rev_8_21_14_2_50_48_46]PIW44976.1 MAG: hypothetical protein COW20_21710 [bacterium (Candidatus Blackallbacteria) CG13_big_fil_rev_8_21_14_2_50_49_14]
MADMQLTIHKLSAGFALLFLVACQPGLPVTGSSPSPSPVNTPVPSASPTAVSSALPTPLPTVEPVATPQPTATPSPEATASPTPEPSPQPTTTPVPGPSLLPEIQFVRLKTIAGLDKPGTAENGSRTDVAPMPENMTAIEADNEGNIWMLDRSNGRLVYITPEITRPTTNVNFVPDYRLFWVRKTDLNTPTGMAFDRKNGYFYIVEQNAHRVIRVDKKDFTHTVVAGNGRQGFTGDGIATEQSMNQPTDVALDPFGNLYITDTGNHLIRKVTPEGKMSTVAGQYTPDTKVVDTNGNGRLDDEVPSYIPIGETSGDGGPAYKARLKEPTYIACDPYGGVYFTSKSNTIRRIQNDRMDVYAGSGQEGYNGDNFASLLANFYYPTELNFGPDGLLYLIDSRNNRIRRIQANGFIQDVAGNGRTTEYVTSLLDLKVIEIQPTTFGFDTKGNLYLYDKAHYRLRITETSS